MFKSFEPNLSQRDLEQVLSEHVWAGGGGDFGQDLARRFSLHWKV